MNILNHINDQFSPRIETTVVITESHIDRKTNSKKYTYKNENTER